MHFHIGLADIIEFAWNGLLSVLIFELGRWWQRRHDRQQQAKQTANEPDRLPPPDYLRKPPADQSEPKL